MPQTDVSCYDLSGTGFHLTDLSASRFHAVDLSGAGFYDISEGGFYDISGDNMYDTSFNYIPASIRNIVIEAISNSNSNSKHPRLVFQYTSINIYK